MKLCVVIQSEAFRTSAGMRIRYDRFRECLADPGVTLDTLTCAEIAASKTLDHDVYIFCKTFDTTAVLLARRIRAEGKVVGQDLFDDYFSQYDDSRLERFREWLRDMAPATQFAICSTPRMVEVVRPYMPNIRIVSIEDPIIGYDPLMVAARADAKAARAVESRTLQVVWFGIGDNPYFPVGLADLVACEPDLARMEQIGWKVALRIVTNRRAFEGEGAELLRRLSVDYELVEWTEQVESEELVRATVALLPVNGQSFSRAKSTNRAVTALSGGCQVLSLGFPLYQSLDDHIYCSVDELIADFEEGRSRVSAKSADRLTARLSELANPIEAAASFVREARRAMAAAKPAPTKAAPTLCLIHGRSSTIGLHKLIGSLRGLSVGTILNRSAWNFPVRFDLVDDFMVMRVSEAIAGRFDLAIIANREPLRIRDLTFVEIDLAALGVGPFALHLPEKASSLADLAAYEDVMSFARTCCLAAFAPAEVLLSETSPLHRRPGSRLTIPEMVPETQTADHQMVSSTVTASPPTDLDRRPEATLSLTKRRFRFSAKAQRRDRELALIEGSRLFDRAWYLVTYPDIAASGVSPAGHYLDLGWREGRDPGPRFSSKLYLKSNPDVVGQQVNPLIHYLEHGRGEGRAIAASMHRDRAAVPSIAARDQER